MLQITINEVVALFFLYIIIALLFISVILIVFTSIKIEIKNLRYSSYKIKEERVNREYRLIIKLYLFEKFNFFNLEINGNQFKNKNIKKHLNNLEQKMAKSRNNFDIKILDVLKKISLKIQKLNLEIEVSLEDAAQNAILVGIISILISIFTKRFIERGSKIDWKIKPLYENKNLFNMKLDCIFSAKLIHIIYTIISPFLSI